MTLSAGDFLYVPRGWFHAAETAEVASIHLTFGFFLPTWLDVFQACLKKLSHLEQMRLAPIPVGTNGNFALNSTEAVRMKEYLFQAMSAEDGYAALQSGFKSKRLDSRSGRLLDLGTKGSGRTP